MALTATSTKKTAINVTIDDFNVAVTPSLIAFWDARSNRGGNQIIDRSKHAHHLSLGLGNINGSHQKVADFWASDEAVVFKKRDFAEIVVTGTPLDTQNKTVVIVCEFHLPTGNSYDHDWGTAWDVENYTTAELYKGFNFGVVGRNSYMRIGSSAGQTQQPAGLEVASGRSGAFVPNTRLASSADGGAVGNAIDAVVLATSALVAQDNKFRIESLGNTSPSGFKTFQVWAFNNEPSDLDMTLEFLSAYPNRLPPWWEGK